MRSLLLIFMAATAFAATPGYKVVDKIHIGGTGTFWDYVYVDSGAARLYVSHTNQTEVVDLKTNKVIGTIKDTARVHGIAIAADLNRGFTSNGGTNNVTVFDLKTLATVATVTTGTNPDAILYEPSTHKVFAFNGNSKDATVIDAKTGAVLATVPVGGKPEFSQTDGKGKVFFNVEDTSEIVEMDAAKATLTKRIPLAPCEEPTGLAIDRQKNHLFAACGNRMMAIVDSKAGKLIATVPIGAGADGAAFDDGMAFSSNGGDGTVTVVGEQGGKWIVLETVPTQRTARTMGVDPKTHRLYLPAAENGPAPAPKEGKAPKGGGRGPLLPDSFSIVVVAR